MRQRGCLSHRLFLGLESAAVRQSIEACDGTATVEGQTGCDATFVAHLPTFETGSHQQLGTQAPSKPATDGTAGACAIDHAETARCSIARRRRCRGRRRVGITKRGRLRPRSTSTPALPATDRTTYPDARPAPSHRRGVYSQACQRYGHSLASWRQHSVMVDPQPVTTAAVSPCAVTVNCSGRHRVCWKTVSSNSVRCSSVGRWRDQCQ